MDQLALLILAVLGGAGIAGAAFYMVGRRSERRDAEAQGRSAAQQAERLLSQAQRDAEAGKAEALLSAKEEIMKLREEWEQEAKRRREELERHQERLEERETLIDRKLNTLDDRERELQQRDRTLKGREQAVKSKGDELVRLEAERRQQLEQVSGLTSAEAKQQLMQEMTDAARSEAAAVVRDIREEAKRTADREAKKVVTLAIQRLAADQTTETTVSAVSLPNDEMKGRIIGREGRNIRAFETATGVDVIIDDTPDTVVVSCFDPVRREVARRALEQLIADGRIHPGRIEEVVAKVRVELEQQIVEAGEETVYELGIRGMHAELVKLVGRMKYRTSYGQNMLAHSKEVAWLAGIIAAELKLDVHLAKRAALLHDIGKVLTHQHEGTHVELGVEVAKRYSEHGVVINAIAAHHDDVPHESPISVIVQAADAVSGARPGARREAFETYVKRLTALEDIAASYKGVEKAFAIQAGREIRIAVLPNEIDDATAVELSEQIARRVENELQYPGQIKIVVVRETRAVDFAR
ncbi:MAG: ribonuclease Y [Gemmatimonadales bacterium]|nr:ribonuclease Y [Gemmatimonadales bacterium]NIN12223.1 ribonuclease Y [Gemmatimonadales bacterium]NIN50638.1 ribonuclease Y [Gemmatimonadales bacterium]NIP08102.1 ribonuclease Y [Gemmatimonadales bacterium]NIR03392.1 ribonuclease Y [Gemmatimonadales bacterium]